MNKCVSLKESFLESADVRYYISVRREMILNLLQRNIVIPKVKDVQYGIHLFTGHLLQIWEDGVYLIYLKKQIIPIMFCLKRIYVLITKILKEMLIVMVWHLNYAFHTVSWNTLEES